MHNGQMFVLGLIAISTFGGVAGTWVKAHTGMPLEGRRERRFRRQGRMVRGVMTGFRDEPSDLGSERQIQLLSQENATLTGQVSRLEERLRVLERIATDPAERTAREIDALRDR